MARTKRGTPPYLTLGPDDVIVAPEEGWVFTSASGSTATIAHGGFLPGWDQNCRFRLSRSFTFPPDLKSRLGLGEDSEIEVVTRIRTGGGLASWVTWRAPLRQRELEIAVHPDSASVARSIRLEASAVLARASASRHALAASDPGAILWTSVWEARIEGGRVRLAIEAASFRRDARWREHADALVHVDTADDAATPLEDGIFVYLNADFPQFVRAVESNDPTAQAIVWEAVVRRCILGSLAMDLSSDESTVEGSLGHQLRAWRRLAFAGQSSHGIRQLALEQPSRFEAMIQHWVGVCANLYRETEP